MEYVVGVKILPRTEVLDSQGRAVEKTLSHHGFENLSGCRVGKYVTLNIKADNEDSALKEAEKVSEFVLYNPLIESFEMEIVK
ncbi:MAG: phosphoribosylformylglycinamidine synthase subunit PurS [Bdellovibrionales bacterium]|nr:phosphoribosylformylglycinamidine synthase subunit PurS [Bdellovibrionales bacterium]